MPHRIRHALKSCIQLSFSAVNIRNDVVARSYHVAGAPSALRGQVPSKPAGSSRTASRTGVVDEPVRRDAHRGAVDYPDRGQCGFRATLLGWDEGFDAAGVQGHCCIERSDDRATGDLPVRHVRSAPSRPFSLSTRPCGFDLRPFGGARAKILRRRCRRDWLNATVPGKVLSRPIGQFDLKVEVSEVDGVKIEEAKAAIRSTHRGFPESAL